MSMTLQTTRFGATIMTKTDVKDDYRHVQEAYKLLRQFDVQDAFVRITDTDPKDGKFRTFFANGPEALLLAAVDQATSKIDPPDNTNPKLQEQANLLRNQAIASVFKQEIKPQHFEVQVLEKDTWMSGWRFFEELKARAELHHELLTTI